MPPFDRQEVQDGQNDWFFPNPNEALESVDDCKLYDPGYGKSVPAPEIEGVTFFSNGTTLNSTIWLSGPVGEFLNDSHSAFQNYSFVSRYFRVSFAIGSVFHTYSDYAAGIKNEGGGWFRQWEEISPRNAREMLHTEFLKDPIGDQDYVRIIIPLDKMNNPKQFTMIFSTTAVFEINNKRCHLADATLPLPVPPPEFTFSVSSNPLLIRQGEEKTAQLQVNSTSPTSSHVFFNMKGVNDIESKLLASNTTVPAKGAASVPLRVKITDHAEIRPYTMQLGARIFLPTTIVHSESGGKFNNTLALNTSKQTELTIHVLPPLQWDEQISNFWTRVGSPITFVFGIIAVSVPWLLNELRKKYKNKKGKSQSDISTGWGE